MSVDWYAIQDEYDDLLLKGNKTTQEVRRIDEIEAALVRRWGLDSGLLEPIEDVPYE